MKAQGFQGKSLANFYRFADDGGQKTFQTFRIENIFKKRIIGKFYALLPGAEIEKFFLKMGREGKKRIVHLSIVHEKPDNFRTGRRILKERRKRKGRERGLGMGRFGGRIVILSDLKRTKNGVIIKHRRPP